MNDRLDKICFLPPPADTPWTGPPPDSPGVRIRRRDDRQVHIGLPLFWFDPPWHHVDARVADQIAVAIAELGIVVSALRSDLSTDEGEPQFCVPSKPDEDAPAIESDEETESLFLPRMLPYRAERYGFHPDDFVGARIVDVRLSIARDPEGHFGYSPERIARWEATPEDEPLAGGGWVPAASFPPDVESFEQLDAKLQQLRQLSPHAAVFVSFGPHRLREELPKILASKPDGVILRLDDIQLTGMQLAEVTVLSRQMIDEVSSELPLWIVPGPMTADDAAKLVALGASAVAVDAWCSEIVAAAIQMPQTTSGQPGYSSLGVDNTVVQQEMEEQLLPKIARFQGLSTSMDTIPGDQRLASLSGRWAKAVGIPALALPGVADDV